MEFKIKQALIGDGTIRVNNDKHYKGSSSNSHNNKTPFWDRNKNIVNDGVVDAKTTRSHKPFIISKDHLRQRKKNLKITSQREHLHHWVNHLNHQ